MLGANFLFLSLQNAQMLEMLQGAPRVGLPPPLPAAQKLLKFAPLRGLRVMASTALGTRGGMATGKPLLHPVTCPRPGGAPGTAGSGPIRWQRSTFR